MSDTLQGAPAEDVVAGEVTQSGGNRRQLVLLLAVAGVVILAAAAYFLFLSGGSSDEELPPVTSASQPDEATGGNNNNEKETEGKIPAEVDDNFKVGRDPFQPLAAEQVVVAAEPDPASDADSTDSTTQGTSDVTSTVYKVTLVDAKAGSATISINGTEYPVSVGDVFPSDDTGPFKLLKVDGAAGTAKIVFGSDVPMDLTEGEQTTLVA